MPDVPLELLHAIAMDIKSDSVLFQLRLVSKTLNSVATPLAFRVITVKDSVESADTLAFFQGCDPSVTSVVREATFEGDPETTVDGPRHQLAGEGKPKRQVGGDGRRS
ncbi:hypothetical protein B0H17DRAFT_1082202 [Mycena rosella]|uniref:F-box domain-containing protein n=1 Tax=Mycena rosella TaxID=1033263 RepID=A0AAD7G765_MYCRO|nr:hypothetical protein B0H17DRAFT_1082202 [Mycena rosella]